VGDPFEYLINTWAMGLGAQGLTNPEWSFLSTAFCKPDEIFIRGDDDFRVNQVRRQSSITRRAGGDLVPCLEKLERPT
jgi:hypothetical protein